MIRIRTPRLAATVLAAIAVTMAAALAAPGAAHADSPDPSVLEPFTAPACPGETDSTPATATGPVGNLLEVFGQRLTDYNAGNVVVLYSNYGDNSNANYIPPTCGTRYVESVGGPVSEWMYCTDLDSHTCGGTDADGYLLNQDGDRIPGMSDLSDGNPKLTPDQEKLIAYLVRNGHEYDNPSVFDDVSFADPNGTSSQRGALQLLVWCISDPVSMEQWDAGNLACINSMDAEEQARLLALIPDSPVIEIDLGGPSVTLKPGETAEITLRTNLFEQPIELSWAGLAGTLTVLSGDATLGSGEIIVQGDDASVLTTIRLGFTTTEVGTVEFEASAQPDSVEHIGWSQSPGISSSDELPCQVYATFRSTELATVSDRASATFAAGDGTSGSGSGITRLADTGAELTPLLASGALLLGFGIVVASTGSLIGRRRPQD